MVERLLNHVSGSFAGVAGVYNRFRYADDVRAALQAWDVHVATEAGLKLAGRERKNVIGNRP